MGGKLYELEGLANRACQPDQNYLVHGRSRGRGLTMTAMFSGDIKLRKSVSMVTCTKG